MSSLQTTILTDSIILDVEALYHGLPIPDTYNLQSFYSFVESVVLYENILVHPVDLSQTFFLFDNLRRAKDKLRISMDHPPLIISLYESNIITNLFKFIENMPLDLASKKCQILAEYVGKPMTLSLFDYLGMIIDPSRSRLYSEWWERSLDFACDFLRGKTIQQLIVQFEEAFKKLKEESPPPQFVPGIFQMIDDFNMYKTICEQYNLSLTDNHIFPYFTLKKTELSIPEHAYKKICDIFNLKVEKLKKFTGIKNFYIPPLPTILLDRCKSPKDILEELKKLRDEYKPLRECFSTYSRLIENADSIKDQLEIAESFEESLEKIEEKSSRRKSRLLWRIWCLTRSGGLLKITTELLDRLYRQDIDAQILYRVEGLYDILEASLTIKHSGNLVQQVFGKQPSFTELTKASEYYKLLDNLIRHGHA